MIDDDEDSRSTSLFFFFSLSCLQIYASRVLASSYSANDLEDLAEILRVVWRCFRGLAGAE